MLLHDVRTVGARRGNHRRRTRGRCVCHTCAKLGLFKTFANAVGIIDPTPTSAIEQTTAGPNYNNEPRIGGVFHKDANSPNLLDADGDKGGGENAVEIFTPQGGAGGGEVDGAFEGEFRITSASWNEALADKESSVYEEMTRNLLEELRKIYPGDDLNISIYDLSEGSVIVKFRFVVRHSEYENTLIMEFYSRL